MRLSFFLEEILELRRMVTFLSGPRTKHGSNPHMRIPNTFPSRQNYQRPSYNLKTGKTRNEIWRQISTYLICWKNEISSHLTFTYPQNSRFSYTYSTGNGPPFPPCRKIEGNQVAFVANFETAYFARSHDRTAGNFLRKTDLVQTEIEEKQTSVPEASFTPAFAVWSIFTILNRGSARQVAPSAD